jgi:hypothetical protein
MLETKRGRSTADLGDRPKAEKMLPWIKITATAFAAQEEK